MKKRLLAVLLSLCMILGLLPVGVLAADADVVASGYCGGDESMNGRNLAWKLTSDGTLTISGLGLMCDYERDGVDGIMPPWWRDDRIQTVKITEGVKNIGTCAFYSLQNLTSVTLPSTMTSIGRFAFGWCGKLSEISIPSSVTDIGVHAFENTSLASVKIPKAVTSIGSGAFSWCKNLKTIDVEVGNIQYISLEGVLFDTNQQTLLHCPAGKEGSYRIPTGVKTIGDRAFEGCTGLTGIGIPNSVTTIGNYAFYGCTELTGILIPNSVTTIGADAFACCTSLTGIKIPDSVKTLGQNAFWNCLGLRRVVLSRGIKTIEWGAFSDCIGLRSAVIPASVTEISECAFGSNSEMYWGADWAPLIVYSYSSSAAEQYVQEYNNREDNAKDMSMTFAALDKPTKVTLKFTDVVSGEYYEASVQWAVEQNVTTGTSASTFSPYDSCTRAQAVTFLWRAAGCPEPGNTKNPFADVSSGEYYYKAVLWAVEQGITNGIDATHFAPNSTCNRAQIVTFLYRFEGSPVAGSNPFVDVAIEDYFSDAVSWAMECGVTTGTTAKEFSPLSDCIRAQIVTFLYRDIVGA